jgi:hypothetical protein
MLTAGVTFILNSRLCTSVGHRVPFRSKLLTFNLTWAARLANEYYKGANRAGIYSFLSPTLYPRILNTSNFSVYSLVDIQVATVSGQVKIPPNNAINDHARDFWRIRQLILVASTNIRAAVHPRFICLSHLTTAVNSVGIFS